MRVSFEEYQLDTELRTLQRSGQTVELQDKAFDVLAYLIEHRDRFVPQEELLDVLWLGVNVSPGALSKAIQKARQAVADDGDHQTVLRTKHGHGFRFVADVTDLVEPEATRPAPASIWARPAAMAGIAALLLGIALVWLLQRQTENQISDHVLAVLPFVNMSADADQEYFADGIAEELLNTLAQFEDLRVVGRTSSFSFKHSDADFKEMGEALNADVILEGSVRTAGDRVRITAQLVDAKDGLHRWSQTYDRKLTDIFAIQTEIATAIADALRLNLSSEGHERLATPPTDNLEAYQNYLLGKRLLDERTSTATAKAVELFEQAIDLDPEFALAYAGLADGFCMQAGGFSDLSTKEMIARARAAIDKALALDDRSGEVQRALGDVRLYENDFAGAEAAFQRAMALSPNSSLIYSDYSYLLSDLGRDEEALVLAKKAVELDPLSLSAIKGVGTRLERLGRFDEGLAWYERALEIDPEFPEAYLRIGIHHWMVTGRLDEAVVWWRKALAIDPNPHDFATYGWLLLDLGDSDEGAYWISHAYELAPEQELPIAAMQALALDRGDDAAARFYGEKTYGIFPRDIFALSLLRDGDVKLGRYAEARARYEEHYPELLSEEDPRIERGNYGAAVDLALILDRTRDSERSELLRERSLELLRSISRLGQIGYAVTDVKIHAQRGEKQKALSALRQAIDAGWRVGWWWELKLKPDLEPLYDEPEFQAMVAEIEADMATQLARVREMERNGELEPIPEVSATTH
jgi:TolB-like protein/DNA-binding winged helix-turn-helix (wHTH) protein/Tfp pilus assembly protein PilF